MFILKRKQIIKILIVWWFVFSTLSLFQFNLFGVLTVAGTLFLLIVPGWLTIIIIGLKNISFWENIIFIIVFSLFELMVSGVIANFLIKTSTKPLDATNLVFVVAYLFWVLLIFANKKIRDIKVKLHKYIFFDNEQDFLFVSASMLFVFLSVLGSIILNVGGSNFVTMFMIFFMAVYIVVLSFRQKELSDNAIPTTLFFISLSLLLMTSLRGWYISGHDIQREFFVFQLAKDAGFWSMSKYQDAYNACLSITVLPTMISNLTMFSDVYIYKVLYQIIFAISPVIVYFISLNWAGRLISMLSAFYFIAFPTFFQDMPFLIRQEVAFLFFGAMVYVLFQKHIKNSLRQFLFIVFGVGIVLSHYSTTYTVLFVLGLTVVSMPIFRKLINKYRENKIFRLTALDVVYSDKDKERKRISFLSVLIIAIFAILWTSGITKTNGHLAKVTSEITDAVLNGFGGDRSQDALSFFKFGVVDSSKESFEKYIKNEVTDLRSSSISEYYSDEIVGKYNTRVLDKIKLPITGIGKIKILFGLNLSDITSFVGQLLIKVLELALAVGVLYVIFRRRMVGAINSEYYVISLFFIFFIFLNIILPVLSIEYGVFRALLQSMFIVGPFIVIGVFFIWAEVRLCFVKIKNILFHFGKNIYVPLRLNNHAPAVFVAFFLLYSTGFVSQTMGNNYPMMQLNNVGNDYDHYYVDEKEHEAVYWFKDFLESNNDKSVFIQADRYGQKKLHSIMANDIFGSIYPGVVKKNSYVFLTRANVEDERAVVVHNGQLITYEYPLEFLEENKELIYDNGEVRIYK